MTDPTVLEEGDTITFDIGPLSSVECEVSDKDVQDIGITQVFAVGFTADSEVWVLQGGTSEEEATLSKEGSMDPYDEERISVDIEWSDIRVIE